ncbi:PAS domain S-box protein [Spizellomyces punctatus DAOM BR117]|uniref:PAS domain S-box protein n=1 Tax=Spizellomyces punctatus (strain DAOM BR117) TaxID=645134 RepID=A0A0L0HUT4_SPIPD|nr:PAS domain S-box protein [Spizellomyces punctatus DAOM BR117]KND04650.1 PAS domain S-box protein [Spizellomyces punctatus DAOM BR117]|eukprot:XP_016612689.1 PAS domain S-box protein [Spizellomyces punctatus DAOM BR117]
MWENVEEVPRESSHLPSPADSNDDIARSSLSTTEQPLKKGMFHILLFEYISPSSARLSAFLLGLPSLVPIIAVGVLFHQFNLLAEDALGLAFTTLLLSIALETGRRYTEEGKVALLTSHVGEIEAELSTYRTAFEDNPSYMAIIDVMKRRMSDDEIDAERKSSGFQDRTRSWHYDYRAVKLNRGAVKIYGVEASRILGKWARSDLGRPTEAVDYCGRHCEEARRTGRVVEWEQEYPNLYMGNQDGKPEGTTTLVVRAVYLGPSTTNGCSSYLLMLRDCSEERRAMEALRESEKRLETIMDAATDGVWEWDIPNDDFRFSHRLARYLGYDEDEYRAIYGTVEGYQNAVHPADRSRMNNVTMDILSGKHQLDNFQMERRLLTKSGSYIWLLNRGKILARDADGKPTKLVGAHIDVSDRKAVEFALEQKTKQLDEKNQLLDEKNRQLDEKNRELDLAVQLKAEFLANISHEFRTPLNGIVGLGEVLWDTQLNAEQRDLLKSIRECSDGLLLIVNDVLDFSKIDAGKMSLENRPFDLRTCITNAVSVLNLKAKEKQIGLTTVVDSAVPSIVIGDGNRLRQVLINLVGNAVKFTKSGGVSIRAWTVDDSGRHFEQRRFTFTDKSSPNTNTNAEKPEIPEIDERREKPEKPRRPTHFLTRTPTSSPTSLTALVHFEVRDTGIGIPATRLCRLFQPFSQVDASTSRQYGGTGLGLAISKQLVQLMDPGGEGIRVESVEDAGSVFSFRIRFPVYEGELEAELGAWDHEKDGRRKEEWKRIADKVPVKILLAEDNLINQKVSIRLLAQLGYNSAIDIANNGVEAVEMSRRTPYHVILMDVQMPRMSGIEATRVIRKERGGIADGGPAIIALTANAMASDRDQCLAAGMDGHIGKPFKIETLAWALEAFGGNVLELQQNNRFDAVDETKESTEDLAPYRGFPTDATA